MVWESSSLVPERHCSVVPGRTASAASKTALAAGSGLDEVRAHAGVLGALAGEEKGYLTHCIAPARTFSAPLTRSSTMSSALWRSFTMPATCPHRKLPFS